jgi:hypothetical protein
MVEHRQEQRARSDLAVRVSGRDANGDAFSQSVNAAMSAKVSLCYREYLGTCDPETWFGWNTRAGRLVTELCGLEIRTRI